MFIKMKRGWEIPERHATPEHVFFNRRQFLVTGAAIGAVTALLGVRREAGGAGGSRRRAGRARSLRRRSIRSSATRPTSSTAT